MHLAMMMHGKVEVQCHAFLTSNVHRSARSALHSNHLAPAFTQHKAWWVPVTIWTLGRRYMDAARKQMIIPQLFSSELSQYTE